MPLPDDSKRFTWFLRLGTAVILITVLSLGREVLMPIAFAGLLVFLLAPLVVRLTRWGIPKAIAIITSVMLAFSVVGAIGWLVADQIARLGRELPNYEQNLHRKIVALKQPHTPKALEGLANMVENLGKEIATPAAEVGEAGVDGAAVAKPVQVEVRAAPSSPLDMARKILWPILRPLATVGIVAVFVVAMLFQREDLRERFIKLVSAGRLNVATQAVDDASQRITRYLWMQLLVNGTYGVPIGVGLYFIGVPNALLWGFMASILRFIPFLGPWIAASFPIMLAIVVDPGWTMLLYTLGLFLVMELISNNVIEIVVYGASTGISNIALLFAAVFWTWLWGVGGLVLSTPLTVCFLVMGKYVPSLRGLSTLLGSEPVLEPPAQFYQRMLSMEAEDMIDLAEKFVDENSLEEFYDAVFIPALIFAEEDRHSGALPETRQTFIFQASRDLIEELERRDERASARREKALPEEERAPALPALPAVPQVVGIPARDTADELVALMLSHLLRRRRVHTAVLALGADVAGAFAGPQRDQIKAGFISALPPSALIGARSLCRRVKLQHPDFPVVLGIWSREANLDHLKERLAMASPTDVVTSLAGAVARLEALVGVDPIQPGRLPTSEQAP